MTPLRHDKDMRAAQILGWASGMPFSDRGLAT
jgi:hypothetical protein